MDLKRIHNVDIYVNGELVDINSNKNLGLRINNAFSTPEKIETISTTYSFAFNLPITPKNNKIFNYANVLSKRGKFNKSYNVSVEIDHLTAFTGLLMVQSISKENGYKCNIYVNKVNTVEEVFGESLMSDLSDWNVEFNLAETMNDVNKKVSQGQNLDCFYPLVSYGMFQKVPKDTGFYTSKHLIDEYNRFYMQNFYPSINLLETVKRCFEHKGYSLQGDILSDDTIKRIYMSTSLADGQDPPYNYGLGKIGKCHVSTTFKNVLPSTRGSYDEIATHTVQDLPIKMYKVGVDVQSGNMVYNFDSVNVYDIWTNTEGTSTFGTTTTDNTYLFRQNRLVAPISGFYKIQFKYTFSIENNRPWEITDFVNAAPPTQTHAIITTRTRTPANHFGEYPTELHIIKNEDDNMIYPIFPTTALENLYRTGGSGEVYNTSAYPHEPYGESKLSTPTNKYPFGYIPQVGSVLNFDPRNSENFIMGSSAAAHYRYNSVMRNGRSWDNACAYIGQTRYQSPKPYMGIKGVQSPYGRGTLPEPEATTDYGMNTLPNGQCTMNLTETKQEGTIQAIVYLEKNDMLQLKLVTRNWNVTDDVDDTVYYNDCRVDVTAEIDFSVFSEPTISIESPSMDWNNETLFSSDLNLVNFLNKDEKMSDFINNFIKEFNLSYSQNGNVITLNKQKFYSTVRSVVDLSDRVSEADMEVGMINYPSQMAVKYSINESERGFYNSVPFDKLELSNWKDYADRGYDIIKITDDENSAESTVQLSTSYNWFDTFTKNGKELKLASVALDEWMIDGYKDAEMMSKDGYNLKRRYWFPPTSSTNESVAINNDSSEMVDIYTVSNEYNNFELSYHLPKNNKDTLLSQFFNIFYPLDSNTVTFKCYLTTMEYINIVNGANIRIDDDIYIVTEVQAYDPTGVNMTTIVAIKK